MSDNVKQYGDSRVQKGGNNGAPVHPKPTNLRPTPPESQQSSKNPSK